MPEKVNNFKKHESFLLRALVQLHILIQRGIELVFRWIAMFCGRVSWSGRFGLLLTVMAGIWWNYGWFGDKIFFVLAEISPEQQAALAANNYLTQLELFKIIAWGSGGLMLLGCGVVYWRSRWSYLYLKVAGALFGSCSLAWIFLQFNLTGALISLNREDYDKHLRNEYLFVALWILVGLLFIFALFAYLAALRPARNYFDPALTDDKLIKAVDAIKSGNGDVAMRNSSLWSVWYHFAILLVIPLIGRGCFYDAYDIPKGDGGSVVTQYVQMVEKPKKKRKKEYVFNPNSAIIFKVPDLNDDSRSEELDKITQNEYTAQAIPGFGPQTGKAGRPGWPNGMEDAKIRFIRLQYSGGDWDQDMGRDADYNMLLKLREYAGFNIADATESIKIADLKRWKSKKAPPFVYLTGSGSISLNRQEAKVLRSYLVDEGGMIFADNGGGSFDSGLNSMLKKVLPELEWVDIANDDIIFQHPFYFPNGAPPLWHHSGMRAKGMKFNGRWVVFYHQGDINDAWRTGGSGVTPEIQERAYKMGANVIAYAFTQYLSRHF